MILSDIDSKRGLPHAFIGVRDIWVFWHKARQPRPGNTPPRLRCVCTLKSHSSHKTQPRVLFQSKKRFYVWPQENYASLDAITRAILVEKGSRMGIILEALNWRRRTKTRDVARYSSEMGFRKGFASSPRWRSRRSRDFVVAQKCEKQRGTSRHVSGGTNFRSAISRSSVLYSYAKLRSGNKNGVVYENMPLVRLDFT